MTAADGYQPEPQEVPWPEVVTPDTDGPIAELTAEPAPPLEVWLLLSVYGSRLTIATASTDRKTLETVAQPEGTRTRLVRVTIPDELRP